MSWIGADGEGENMTTSEPTSLGLTSCNTLVKLRAQRVTWAHVVSARERQRDGTYKLFLGVVEHIRSIEYTLRGECSVSEWWFGQRENIQLGGLARQLLVLFHRPGASVNYKRRVCVGIKYLCLYC